MTVRAPANARNWPRVARHRWYELETDFFLARMLRPGDLVLDVGANEGIVTTVAAKLVGESGHVIACEPDAEALSVLARAVRRNDLANATVIPEPLGSSGLTGDAVLAGRLPNLVKIDVDGPELDVLAGLAETLRARPLLIVELSTEAMAQEVLALAHGHGYSTYASRMKFARVLPVSASRDLRRLPVRFELGEVANLFCTPDPIDVDAVWPPWLVPDAYERHFLSAEPFGSPGEFWVEYRRQLLSRSRRAA